MDDAFADESSVGERKYHKNKVIKIEGHFMYLKEIFAVICGFTEIRKSVAKAWGGSWSIVSGLLFLFCLLPV